MFWIEHLGIVVRDLEQSISFYRKLFDSEPIERVAWRGPDADYIASMLGFPRGTLELAAAFFQVPHTNALLEMLHYSGIPQGEMQSTSTDIGASHFGFYVESLDETVTRLDLALAGPPTDIPYGPYKGGRTAYLKDPNGVNIQLMELRNRPGGMAAQLRGSAVQGQR